MSKHPDRHRPYLRPTLSALAAASIALVLGACSSGSDKAAAAAPTAGTPVTASVVVERNVVETQEFSGRMEAIEDVEIRARVGGYIARVLVQPGAQVRKGDVLFVIDPRPYQAEVDRAQAEAAAAAARADLARIEMVRAERLLADRAIAQREYDQQASASRERDANARAAQAALATARLNLEYTSVKAPIDGRVSKEEVTLGNLVDASALLTSVVSTERIYASFEGDEATYLRVARQSQQGKPVAVKAGLASEAGFPHEGRLAFVDNRLDTGTGSVRMRAVLENRDRLLVPGLFARVQIQVGAGEQAARRTLLVADRAIGTDQSRKFVVVVGADGRAEHREVQLGAVVDGLRIVNQGLKAGEQIVTGGLQRVRPGDHLKATLVGMPDATPAATAATAAKAANNKAEG